MRVLHILKTSDGAVWAWRQMCVLKSLGVDVQVVLPAIGKMNKKYEEVGIPVHILNCDIGTVRRFTQFRQMQKKLRGLVAELKPDILHSHFVGTTLFLRLALGRNSGPARIFQVPGPLHLENPLIRKLEILSAGRADQWIASCRLTRRLYLREGINRQRVGFSFYGTDVASLTSGVAGRLRPALNLKPDTKLIGMVAYAYRPKRWLGQRRGIKGHEDLIDAAQLLLSQGRDIALIFVGGAWLNAEHYFESVKAYANSRVGPAAIFLGARNDVPDLYQDFDIAAHPSHSENLGGAVESLLSTTPTVATDVGGFPDIVIPGETGWLCKPNSPESLAKAIAEALDNPALAKSLALKGNELVRRELDVKRTAPQVLRFYCKTIAAHAGGR